MISRRKNVKRRIVTGLLLSFAITSALAQSGAPVKQSGNNITPGQVPWWVTSGVIGGGVSSADSPVTSFGVTNNGGNAFCVASARITAVGRNLLCFGVSTTGPATISLQNYGTASPQAFNVNINGTVYPFPFVTTGVVGPSSSIVGRLAVWNNTTGTLLAQDIPALIKNSLSVSANAADLPSGTTGLLFQVGGADGQVISSLVDAFGVGGIPVFNTRYARGTAASPTAVQSGDTLGILGGVGRGATVYSNAGVQVRFSAAENFTDTAQGTRITLWTTPNGSPDSSVAEAFRVDQDKSVTAYNNFTVNKNISALPTGPTGVAVQVGGADGTVASSVVDAFGVGGIPVFNTRYARNTAASPSAVQSGDTLGILGGMGRGTTVYSGANVQVRFNATQTFTDTAQGTRASIWTTPNGSTNAGTVEAFRVDQDKSTQTLGLLKAGPTADTNSTDSTIVISNNSTKLPLHNPAVNANEQWVAQFGIVDGSPGGFGIDTFGTVAFGVMDFRAARGTAASPSALQAGDFIGVVGGLGYGTTRYTGGAAQMRYYAAENFTDTTAGAYISFLTTPIGANPFGGGKEALRLDQDRSVNVFGSLVVNPTATLIPANGATLPAAPANTVVHIGNIAGNNTLAVLDSYGAGTFPIYNTRFARGTQSALTAAQSGDVLGVLGGIGYGTTGYGFASGQVRFAATENWTDTAQGARVSLFTTPNGSTGATPVEAARFDQNLAATLFGTLSISGVSASLATGTAIPAGGTAGTGYLLSSTANFGIFFGSGAPTLAAAKGSLYLRSNGSTTNDRAYINTDGSTTWTPLTTGS